MPDDPDKLVTLEYAKASEPPASLGLESPAFILAWVSSGLGLLSSLTRDGGNTAIGVYPLCGVAQIVAAVFTIAIIRGRGHKPRAITIWALIQGVAMTGWGLYLNM